MAILVECFLLHQLPQTVNSKSELCILLRNMKFQQAIDSTL